MHLNFFQKITNISDRLNNIKQLRLLIGNTSNRETIEQIAQGYKRLELISDRLEAESYPKRSQIKEIKADTAANVRSDLELLDQTDETQELINNLVQMIEEKRLQVKAIDRELNALRRSKTTGQDLFNYLVQIYSQHDLYRWSDRRS